MKNPFPHFVQENMLIGMTKEQARYAAHVINQHEKLVAMLRRVQWDQANQCLVCNANRYGRSGKHRPSCKLMALLKAEEEA